MQTSQVKENKRLLIQFRNRIEASLCENEHSLLRCIEILRFSMLKVLKILINKKVEGNCFRTKTLGMLTLYKIIALVFHDLFFKRNPPKDFRSRKKIFDFLCFRPFFSRPFNENFKFLKNCPYDIYKFFFSYSQLFYIQRLLYTQWHQNRNTGIWET